MCTYVCTYLCIHYNVNIYIFSTHTYVYTHTHMYILFFKKKNTFGARNIDFNQKRRKTWVVNQVWYISEFITLSKQNRSFIHIDNSKMAKFAGDDMKEWMTMDDIFIMKISFGTFCPLVFKIKGGGKSRFTVVHLENNTVINT